MSSKEENNQEPQVQKKSIEPQIIAAVIAGIFTCIAAVIGLGQPFVNKIISETPTSGQNSSATTLYDDFSSNNLDTTRWTKFDQYGCRIEQKDGELHLSGNNTGSSFVICDIASEEKDFSEIGAIEAELFAEDGATGDYQIVEVDFASEQAATNGDIWFAQCGIRLIPQEGVTEVFLNIHDYPAGEPEFYETAKAEVEQWYKVRLESVPSTGEIKCYVNDQLFKQHTPLNADKIRSSAFRRQILSYWASNSKGDFKVDNVHFYPSEE